MKNKLSQIILGIIILIAVFLRFYQLGSVPPSPDWDEAALGYNAYSILETGKDEYGKNLPIILRSFDDYKPALYAYLVIPFVKILGLNIFAVRAPAAVFGVMGVILTYYLVIELFGIRRPKFPHTKSYSGATEALALVSAFLFAISPWDLQFSRIAFEAQVGMVLNIGAVLFFLKGLRKGPYLLLSALLASLSIYVYQSEKVYLPIIFIALVIIFGKEIIKASKTYIIGAVLLGIVLCLPMIGSVFFDQGALMRAKGVSVFSDQTTVAKKGAEKLASDYARGDLLGLVLDNRRVEYVKSVVSGYISHFNPNWLFITGDIERHHAPGMGLLYLFELPFLLIGIYILIFGNYERKTKLTVFSIFLIAALPASVTSGVPHAVRTINFLPTFQIFTALGLIAAYAWVSSIKYRVLSIMPIRFILTSSFLILVIFNFVYFLNQYFVQQNYYNSESWQYGYEQAIDYIKPISGKYNAIVVSNKPPLDQSYIFFLYYLKHNPALYQKSGGTGTGGFAENHRGFDNFVFRPIEWEKEESGTLLIARPEDVKGGKVLQTINYLNGKPAIVIVEK